MSSDLFIKTGTYDPRKRFNFTNIWDKDFTFYWAKIPITVKPGETVQLKHHLAVLATTQLVDTIMGEEIKKEEDAVKAKTDNYHYRSPRAGSIGVPAARKVYEDKILKEIPVEQGNDAELQVIRSQLAEEIKRDLAGENSPAITKGSDIGLTDVKAFEEINLPHK